MTSYTSWMKQLPDSHSVCTLSIPGTHCTMSQYGGPSHQCQTLPLSKQYETGIRFVDIRCRHFNDGLLIHHDVIYQLANLDNVLEVTEKFLDAHDTEIVFMRIDEECKPESNTTTFAEAVQLCLNRFSSTLFYQGEEFPLVEEARGKLVVLRDYDGGSGSVGLPYGSLDVKDGGKIPSLLLEDIEAKWHTVRSNLDRAKQGSVSSMYLTYCSGTSALAWPLAVAERVNSYLSDFLKGKTRWGIVAMDFPDAELIGKIIKSNF